MIRDVFINLLGKGAGINGKKAGSGYLVHPGDVSLPLGQEVVALPFTEL